MLKSILYMYTQFCVPNMFFLVFLSFTVAQEHKRKGKSKSSSAGTTSPSSPVSSGSPPGTPANRRDADAHSVSIDFDRELREYLAKNFEEQFDFYQKKFSSANSTFIQVHEDTSIVQCHTIFCSFRYPMIVVVNSNEEVTGVILRDDLSKFIADKIKHSKILLRILR